MGSLVAAPRGDKPLRCGSLNGTRQSREGGVPGGGVGDGGVWVRDVRGPAGESLW